MLDGLDRLPTLDGERVRLRWLEPADAPDLFAIFSDTEVTRYWSSPAWTSIAQALELVEGVHQMFEARTLFQWGTEWVASGRIIGHVTLASLDAANGRAEIGFSLAREHWGHGYATEAARLALDFAFEELALRRIEADVDPRNAPSIALLERLGFVREGLARERWCVGGEIQDSLLMGLLARDYPRVNEG